MKLKSLLLMALILAVASIGFAQSKANAKERRDLFQLISNDKLLTDMLDGTGEKVDSKTAGLLIIKKTDLNRDGRPEYMVELTSQKYCGLAGNCLNWIYEKKGGEYNLLLSTNTRSLTLQKTSTHKFRDLETEDRGEDFYTYNVVDYKFNGDKYEAKRCHNIVMAKKGNKYKTVPTVCRED